MTRKTIAIATLLCLTFALASTNAGENWTNFRGPGNQGNSDAKNLPVTWSESKNIAWKTPIAGKAWSSPVIWGDRIWLTNAPEGGNWLAVICVDKNTGKVLINKRLYNVAGPQYCHPFNSYASPSPVIEEGRLYVSFGSPYNACLNPETGDVIWERTDFVCNHFRGPGSSPFIYKNLLILHFDGADEQYIAAMDKRTGKTVWKTERTVDFQDVDKKTGKAFREGDLRKAYSTPVLAEVDGKPVLISLGSMAIYGYNPDTGKELWRVDAIGSHSGGTRPVVAHGLAYVPIGSKQELWAIKPGGSGNVTDTHIAWKYKNAVPMRPSVLSIGDDLFMVDNGGVAACLDAKTGKEIWRKRVSGNFSSSPIFADGKIYFNDETGKSTVIAASREYKVLGVNELGDPNTPSKTHGFMASPAVSGSALFLRSRTDLYRIENR